MRIQTPNIDHTAPFSERAMAIIDWAFGGIHHLDSLDTKWASIRPQWRAKLHQTELSSFDFSTLSKLVVAAHHYAVRVSLRHTKKGLELWLSERDRNDAQLMNDYHPPLTDTVEWFEKWNRGEVI